MHASKTPRQPWEEWNDDAAARLTGRTALVGLTFVKESNSDEVRQYQFYGIVESADRNRGICIFVEAPWNHCRFVMPPAPRTFEKAARGVYRLRASGQQVVDPDFLSTWTINLSGEKFDKLGDTPPGLISTS